MSEEIKDTVMPAKKPMTDEERLLLADKLDKDLDTWMDGLEKRAYTDGWPEDKWEEEMEKHPFFMTSFPENPADASPLLQGIQQLKYDETANTALELAQSYKEDGNFNFKHKKYRMAVMSYTEGLRKKSGDSEMDATLYNNRSAAQFFLKNYRSSLMDCNKCLKLSPGHEKAQLRAIQCCLRQQKPEDAVKLCESYLERHPDNKQVQAFRMEATNLLKKIERDRRKDVRSERRQGEEIAALQAAVAARGVQVEVDGDPEELLLGMHEKPRLLEDGALTWPVFFLYPEYSTSDFVQEFNENDTIMSMLEEVLTEQPDWDQARAYRPDKLSVYYEAGDRSHLHSVTTTSSLGSIIKGKGFVARDWRPAFLVFVKGSVAEMNFVRNYTVIT